MSKDNGIVFGLIFGLFFLHIYITFGRILFCSLHYLSNILNIIRSIITHFLEEKENRRKIIIKNNTITSKMKIRAENL